MSHLTPRDIRNMGQLIDAALAFMQFTGNRDQALMMVLQGTKALLPFLASLVEVQDLQECSKRYYEEGLLTREEYGKIQHLLTGSEVVEAEIVQRREPKEIDWLEQLGKLFGNQ